MTETTKPKRTKVRILTLPHLSQMTRATWLEYPSFDASAYFSWPTTGMFLYPNITPALHSTGATTPVQLLQALVARGTLTAGNYAVLVQGTDLEGTPT